MKKGIKLKAFFLLLSFLGVQFISIACTLINLSHQVIHEVSTHEPHHHEHEHITSSDHKQEKTNESCCVESTSIFLQGLEALPDKLIKAFIGTFQFSKFYQPNEYTLQLNKFETEGISIRPPPSNFKVSFSLRILFQSIQL
ncbi:MAG: hypothetical protein JKY48_11820 [Flavobacteriales bacterium]|nr:hypothetical protein [Flavobacteriales bacterium]